MTKLHKIMGKTATDKISGFKGVVTAYAQYISGCNQCLLSPPVDGDGKYQSGDWFDEQRLEFASKKKVTLDNGVNPGFGPTAPKR